MTRSRFSASQIIHCPAGHAQQAAERGILKAHQADISAQDLCRRHGISDATIYNWRRPYGGMEVADAKRLKALGVGRTG